MESFTFMMHPHGRMHIFPGEFTVVKHAHGHCTTDVFSLCREIEYGECHQVTQTCRTREDALDIANRHGDFVCRDCKNDLPKD